MGDNTVLQDVQVERAVPIVNILWAYWCIVSQKWIKFVQKHYANFVPLPFSQLCSMHFEDSAFTATAQIAESLGMRRRLCKNAVPTVDRITGVPSCSQEKTSDRERRQVRFLNLMWINTFFQHSYNNLIFILNKCRFQQILRRISDVTTGREACSPVYSGDEGTEQLVVESEEKSSASEHTEVLTDKPCENCKALKKKVIQLQKKVSWLKRLKSTLREKIKQARTV